MIIERIKQYLDYRHISVSVFEKSVGMSNASFGKSLKNKGAIGTDKLENILNIYSELSPNWLISGEGPMLKPSGLSIPSVIPLTDSNDKMLDISDIPLYNIDASAGLNKLFANGGELLGKISVPNMPRCDGAVHVIGDSMYPLLKSGDIIAYRIVQSLLSLNFGEIYILQLENDGDISIVVKYVKRSDKGDEYIKLVSYNKEHDPKDVPLFWIKAIARVTFAIRQFSII